MITSLGLKKIPWYFNKMLTLYCTKVTFDDPQKKKGLENIVGKGENAGNNHFPTTFSSL